MLHKSYWVISASLLVTYCTFLRSSIIAKLHVSTPINGHNNYDDDDDDDDYVC